MSTMLSLHMYPQYLRVNFGGDLGGNLGFVKTREAASASFIFAPVFPAFAKDEKNT